jgi:hypothetical protein
MKNFDLKDLFKRKVKSPIPERRVIVGSRFARDWKVIVVCFAIGLISLSLFAWRIYLSNRIAAGYLAPTIESPDTYIKTIDQKRLDADILLLENKQVEFLKLKAAAPKLIDPSL